jgi:hypothetical protein
MDLDNLVEELDENKLRHRQYRLLELYRGKKYFLPVSKKFVELIELKSSNVGIESEYVKVKFARHGEKPEIRTMSIYDYEALIREGPAKLIRRSNE